MKILRNWIIVLFAFLVIHACNGNTFSASPVCDDEENTSCEETSGTSEADAESDPFETDSTVILRGYVSSAFDITVDRVKYDDSEDFYTKQLDKITEEATQSGYDGWALDFDAAIGLEDLKYDMRVYVVAVNSRGFAGESWVDEYGRFELTFPDAGKSAYKIRANKRITITLTNPENADESVMWCYNFSAIEKPVNLDPENNKPVILSSFVTRLTKYECSSLESGGISIPSRTPLQQDEFSSEGDEQ